MKLVASFLFPLLFLLSIGTPAWAAPDLEDAVADGDLDGEDVVVRVGTRAAPRASGSVWLSLVGFAREGPQRGEVGGMLVLGVPFDRIARGSTRVTGPELVRTAAAASAPPPEGPFDLSLSPRLARSCVAAAWRAAGLGADDSRLDGIVSRARWSAILPEARLRAIRYDNLTLASSLDPVSSAPTVLRDTTNANLGLEARLTWRFDRLVYADDEPAFERIRLEHRDARSRVAGKTLDALFHWQRALLDLRTLPPSQVGTRDEVDVSLRVMEAEAALDVLTNGWFGAHKPKRPGAAATREAALSW
ncbi:MAG: hypothetical protein KIT84_01020 [Labilithrix sp.]|nr:hypothetical protein [Labilithrix sp.]MCW5809566.1 hypothetical protein [Labilithrix sp.]